MAVSNLPPVPNTPLVQDPTSDAIWKRWLSAAFTRIIGAVNSVTGTAPIVSSGGADPAISLANSGVTAGSYTFASITVSAKGLITAASSGTASASLSGITAAVAANTIASGNNIGQVWNWAVTTNSVSAFTLGETTAATGGTSTSGIPNQVLLKLNTLASSTMSPLSVYSRAAHVFSVSPTTAQVKFAVGSDPLPTITSVLDPSTGINCDGDAIYFSASGGQAVALTLADLRVPTGATTAPGLTDIGYASLGFYWPATSQMVLTDRFSNDWLTWKSGHSVVSGTSPTITAGGGTSPSIVGKDEVFIVTIGSGGLATSFEVTFANAFTTNPPGCIAQSNTDIVPFKSISTTDKVTVTATAPFSAGSKVTVHCKGWE